MTTTTGRYGIGRRNTVIVRHVTATQGHLLQADTHLVGTGLRRLNIDELPLTRCTQSGGFHRRNLALTAAAFPCARHGSWLPQ